MKKIIHFSFLICILNLFACKKEEIISTPKTTLKYLFLGHIYEESNTIDPRLFHYIRSKEYDQFWLGGDLCAETTADVATLDYLDNIFDLGSPNTHWTLGNHDVRNGNIQRITDKTQRPRFYTANSNGLCILVLDTNLGITEINPQYDLIKSVCDTIQTASHLIVLSHGAAWRKVPELDTINWSPNMDYSGSLFRANPNQKFETSIYPLLQQVANRGIKVINVAGDFGQYQTAYQSISEDGIHFIGSGITSNILWNEQFPTHGHPDKILIFEHNLITKEITWKFQVL